MGKIRVKTIGDEQAEEQEKKELKQKKEGKLSEAKSRSAVKAVRVAGMKGGERVISVGPTEEELAAIDISKVEEIPGVSEEEPKKEKKAKFKTEKRKQLRSNRYLTSKTLVDPKKNYLISEALELLLKMQNGKFDETVELHINTLTQGVSGQITLPHGTGKQTKVIVATDAVISEIEKGKIDFDILVAEPSMMPKLAKVARILGPKGLMPNPKSGTISDKPEEIAKKYEGGLLAFKTEGKAPLIHLVVGKVSFGDKKLEENLKALIAAVKRENIQKAVLKSTMSPGIKIQV